MSSHFYNEQLYPLQDRVLKRIASGGSVFYLTGGTVLGRFLLQHRYSDDLDFFANQIPNFQEEVDKLIKLLKTDFEIQTSNLQDTFARFFVLENGITLKIEFVNDVSFRVGVPQNHPFGFKIDTWQNILSNKLSALSRDAGKDLADILFICLLYSFVWKDAIADSKQKDAWVNEINISQRFFAINPSILNDVKFIPHVDVSTFVDYFKIMARESLHGFENSLFGKQLNGKI